MDDEKKGIPSMAKGFLARLSNMLGTSDGEGKPEEVAAPAAARTDTVRAKDIMVAQDGFFGRIYVVSLDDVLELIGQRSDRLVAGVQLICERTLEEECGANGTFCQKSDGAFFFRLNDADEDRGWARAVRIVNKIGVKVFGERYRTNPDQPQITLAVAEASTLMDNDGGIDMGRVASALRSAKGVAQATLINGWKKFVHNRGRKDEPKWQQLERKPRTTGMTDWAPMERKEADVVKSPTGSPFWTQRADGDRRKASQPFAGNDRRRGRDRRGGGRLDRRR